MFVERLSSAVGGLTSIAGAEAWWAYALLLGVVAAFNPCGFALLPAYLGLYLNDDRVGASVPARVRRSLALSAAVAGSFTVLFGAVGAVFSLASALIVPLLPWLGLGVGAVLVVVGGLALGGRPLVFGRAERAADRLGRSAARPGARGYAAFGFAYGVASLGCALPPFLALVVTAMAAGGPVSALSAFALYGIGMAASLGVISLAAGLLRLGIVARVRTAGRYFGTLGAVLLMLSGAYVVYYWLATGRALLT